MSHQPTELPLFPVDTVLFPGMPLPLHIFERRYRMMITRCLEEQRSFGIVLIKEGQQVGEPAVPHQIGTTARIDHFEHLKDGRMNLITRGERRFRILELVRLRPYIEARVEEILEEDGPLTEQLVEQVRHAFTDYLHLLMRSRSEWMRDVETPLEPVYLSYVIAHVLKVELLDKQQLLEILTTKERLEQELSIVANACEGLKEDLERDNPYRGPRLN